MRWPDSALRVHELAYQVDFFDLRPLITSLSFAWFVLTATGMIQDRVVRVTMNHKGDLGLSGSVELTSDRFDVWHDGGILIPPPPAAVR